MARIERLSLEKFAGRRKFGSLGRKEEQPGQAKHVLGDVGGWLDALRRQGQISSTPDPAEPCADTGVTSAEDVFDKGWVSEKDHYGLEVDLDADNEYEADAIMRKQMATLGFDIDDRSGFPLGGVQLFRDGENEDSGKQEHMRYYGVVEDEDNPGHYKAIFVMEGERLPEQADEDSVPVKHPRMDSQGASESWRLDEEEEEGDEEEKDEGWELEPDDDEESDPDEDDEQDDEVDDEEDDKDAGDEPEEDDGDGPDEVDDDDGGSDDAWDDWDDWDDWSDSE